MANVASRANELKERGCVCVCVRGGGGGGGGGGGKTDGEGEENMGGVSAIRAREKKVNKVNGLFSYCLHTIVIYTQTL